MTPFWQGVVLGVVGLVTVPWIVLTLVMLVIRGWARVKQWRARGIQARVNAAYNRGWVDRGREELKLAAMNPPPAKYTVHELKVNGMTVFPAPDGTPRVRTADEIAVEAFLRTLWHD